ncbi:MAG: diacylglycerol kinase family protein [Rikenellaceae bacterium]
MAESAKIANSGDTSRWFMIVNPAAGKGRGLLDLPRISKLLHDEQIYCEPNFTERKFHAVEYTVAAINKGYRKILVVGGDGTLHEVVNGLFVQQQVKPSEVLLAVIGVGGDNSWMRSYGFESGRYIDIIRAIKEENSFLQDVGVVNYEEAHYRQNRYMVGSGGTGFDSYVVKQFSHRTMKKSTNKWSYIWCVIKSFFRYKHTGAKIYVDDRLIYNNLLFSVAIGISKFNGGGMQQLPEAVADDGLLDMTLIRPIHFWHILFRFRYLFDGNIYRIGHTQRWRGERIRIESTPEMNVEVDGELLGGTPLEFSLLNKAINVVVSKSFLEVMNRE